MTNGEALTNLFPNLTKEYIEETSMYELRNGEGEKFVTIYASAEWWNEPRGDENER